jgi:rubrerythrin
MESLDPAKTLEILKAISDLESSIANLYRYCSELRETEKDFWLALEQDEQKHAQLIQEMAQMMENRKFFCVPSGSFNGSAVKNLKNFVERHLRKLQKLEIPADFKNLLSIAWNIEYSIGEMNYKNLFSIAEGEYETPLQTILSETAAHRSTLGSKITAMRNHIAKPHKLVTPKGHPGVQRKLNHKAVLLRLN